MTDEQRLIDDAGLDGTTRALLRAGREASPSRASKERLLQAVLPTVGAPVVELGGLQAQIGKGLFGSLKGASLSKVVALSVLGTTAAGTFYATRHAESNGAVSSRPVPAAIGAPQTAVAAPVVPHAVRDRGSPGPELLAGANDAAIPIVVPQKGAEGAGAPNFADLPTPNPVLVPSREARSAARTTGGAARRPTSRRGVLAVTSATPALDATTPTSEVRSKSTTPNRGDQRDLAAPKAVESTQGSKTSERHSALLETQLVEELRDLDAVRHAVRAGAEASARQLLAEYYRRFPSGYLRPEAKRLETQISELSPTDRAQQ